MSVNITIFAIIFITSINCTFSVKHNSAKQYLHSLLTAIILSFALVSCGNRYANNDSLVDSLADSSDILAEDEIMADSLKSDKKNNEPQWGSLSFSTSQDALDYMNNSSNASKYSAGIFPIMAKENLPYLTKLLNSPYRRFLIVDKQSMKVVLFDKYGREELRYGIACARNYGTKHKKADSRTPEGFFSVEGIYDSTDWLFTDDNGHTSKVRGQFGPRFIRLKIPNTSQIGIHGTGAPWSIGNRVSHGCIRVTNENILNLVKKVDVGMPVIVSPSALDSKVNQNEGYNISYVSIDPAGTPRILRGHLPSSRPVTAKSDSVEITQDTPDETSISVVTDSI